MSASLVGSEMCIRDRKCAPAGRWACCEGAERAVPSIGPLALRAKGANAPRCPRRLAALLGSLKGPARGPRGLLREWRPARPGGRMLYRWWRWGR
eukprot:7146182-Alexandrium_andersonii.AAC.1